MVRRLSPGAVVPLCLAVLLPAGCTDELPTEPRASVDTDASLAVGPAAGFPIVILGQGPGFDAPAGPLVGTLAEALARVQAGGTIRVHPGTYAVANVEIDKPVTIAAAGAERPVFDAMGGNSSVWMDGMDLGPVTFRGIVFRNTYGDVADPDHYWFGSIVVNGLYDNVLIEDSEFYPADPTNPTPGWEDDYDGNAVYTDGHGNGITVRSSTFTGGDIGLHGSASGTWHVENNTFTGQLNGGVHTGGDGHFEGNRFSACGRTCLNVGSPDGRYSIRDNDFAIDHSSPSHAAIAVAFGRGEVTDNRILGTGGTADPADPSSWPITWAAIGFYQVQEAVVSRNVVQHAYAGIWFDQTTAAGSDNVITDVSVGIGAWGPAEGPVFNNIAVTRSDITDYALPLEGAYTFESLDITCNWWGDAAGPHDMTEEVSASTYTPWATTPVAGTTNPCS